MKALALALLLVAPSVSAQTMFRAAARRVYVDVFVERGGRPVGGLSAEDFVVYDRGVRQPGVKLLDAADQALSTVLVMDTSSSVRGEQLETLARAARRFVAEVDERDEIGVVTLGTRFRVDQPLAQDRPGAAAAMDTLRPGGATALLDGIHAATVLAESGSGRPLVVVFTDGDDNSSWLTRADVVRDMEGSPAVLFAVRVPPSAGLKLRPTRGRSVRKNESAQEQKARATLEDIAAATGGRLLSAESVERVEEAFTTVLAEMRSRYLLVYEPSSTAPGWHPLEVELSEGVKGRVRARTGYVLR